ncbi:tetratricopeptide repeat protein [Micromonospora sp. DR5-3]|uniref:ATP-binding protein n=1 Tax=unclassified Micromonospora TaxID=2617518 RepID=UPI0011DBCCCC|nr:MULTISPECIES: helix-turn-helix transcriptional regulator [unclassified Micromonospora]MCW3818805.1 tetratricopeptide repeat protein [Micromonospora sp. DR5-3]TYC20477.1 helix-turn-helix transcriptional regulator [Micromonospora sp. MP36]
MPEGMAFGPLLRRLRLDADLTLEQLAARSGVSDRAISDMERGVSQGPQARTVTAIADALRLDPESRSALTAAARAGRRRQPATLSRQRRPSGLLHGHLPGTGGDPAAGQTDQAAPLAPTTGTPPVPAQLPADLPVFSGRHHEVVELVDRLTSAAQAAAPLVSVVTGMAGIGKTTLAVHCAHRVAPLCPDGQLFANLRGFDPAGAARTEDVLRGFLDALGVPSRQVPDGVEAQAALYRSRLAGRRMLVLLDNARDTDQVRPLLPGSAGSLVIVTSRSQLPGLVATHGARPTLLDLPDHDDARQVLARRLDAARVAAEPAAVDELIERCARLPLALAIVAARAATHRQFPLAAIAEELRRATGGLAAFTGSEAAVDVRSVFSWSYAALEPAAARLFRLLALHPSPPASVEAAASLAGVPAEDVRPLLNGLTGAHLVAEPACGRYAFHDLLRAYAAELCLTVGSPADRQAALGRMIDHYLHSAYAADRRISPTRPPLHLPTPAPGVTAREFPDEASAVAWLTDERPALLAALDAAHTGGLDGQAWQLAWSLEQYLERWGHWTDWTRTWQTAMRAARRLDDPYALAQAHRGLGLIALIAGTAEEATPHLVEATALFQRVGDVEGQAIAQRGLSFAQERQGRPELALRHAELALELCRSAGDRSGEGLALNLIALQRTQLGDHDAAVPIVELAIVLLAEVGHRRGEAAAWDTLGSVRSALAQPDLAVAAYRRAAELREQVGDRYQQAQTLVRLGGVHADTGDRQAAQDVWRNALALLTEMQHPEAETVTGLLAKVS